MDLVLDDCADGAYDGRIVHLRDLAYPMQVGRQGAQRAVCRGPPHDFHDPDNWAACMRRSRALRERGQQPCPPTPHRSPFMPRPFCAMPTGSLQLCVLYMYWSILYRFPIRMLDNARLGFPLVNCFTLVQPIPACYYKHYYKNACSECMPAIPIVIPI